MTRWTVFLLVFAFAAPLWAVKVKLKSEDKEFEADILKLEDGQVTYKKGRKENTVPLNDFEPESQFVIKDEMTGNLGHELLGLARFALHRGLYRQARDTAKKAMLDDAVKDAAQRLMDVALILEADTALDKAIEALDAKDVEKAGPMLQDVKTRYASTPAALKADILLSTLKRVELEVKAAELEEEAKKAQAEADADEQKRRRPIDDWLTELEEQVGKHGDTKAEADKDCLDNNLSRGLPKYQDAVEALKTIRDKLKDNRKLLKYRGQDEHADRIDDKARVLIIECYYSWASNLYRGQRYDVAATVCAKGIEMDPKDRRFLSLKVDIDEYYDPLEDR
ncbi:MAG: hypothetical protein KDB82_18555 [Planctomycetes bacterium]|nr:hypothetical protein [Planctomycetota bacterium]